MFIQQHLSASDVSGNEDRDKTQIYYPRTHHLGDKCTESSSSPGNWEDFWQRWFLGGFIQIRKGERAVRTEGRAESPGTMSVLGTVAQEGNYKMMLGSSVEVGS